MLISAAAEPRKGITRVDRGNGWDNRHVLNNMVYFEWLVLKPTGPRGGQRYHITRKGRYHLRKAQLALNSETKSKT
jgi:hypothetical protein